MIEIFNALGTDVAVLGNHEFDFGRREVAAARIAESRFPWLATNVRDAAGQPFGGSALLIREAAGLRIGFLGVLTRDTAESRPGPRPGPSTTKCGPCARGRRNCAGSVVDIVVALTHLDLAHDREAADIPGIDLVLGGHDHESRRR